MLFSLCLLGLTPGCMSEASFGTPKISHFANGAGAAISLQFDDSMTTQLANATPLLKAHGIRATFFVITDSWQYKQHQQEWEVDVLKAGHDLGNHTSHHTGAKNIDELTKEIEGCSDHLAKVYGPMPRLTSFAIPGGVPWGFTADQLNPILKKNHLVLTQNRNFFEDGKTDPITFVQKAIDNHWASNVSMHGVGGEWLSTSVTTLTKLLDFLAQHRAAVWVAPEIQIYKYSQERDAAGTPILTRKGNGFTLVVNCDSARLAFSDEPIVVLYDQALTVEVAVPAAWRSIRVVQGSHLWTSPVFHRNGEHVALCPVLPNAGQATIVPGP